MSKKKPLTVNAPATQKQARDWHARIAEYGCVIHRDNKYNFQIHHPLGRTKRVIMGIGKYHIGPWFCFPITLEMHCPNHDHQFHIGKCKNAFVREYGSQCGRYRIMCEELEADGPLPFDADVMAAIMATGV